MKIKKKNYGKIGQKLKIILDQNLITHMMQSIWKSDSIQTLIYPYDKHKICMMLS